MTERHRCDCGEPLRPDNPTSVCAECVYIARNARLLTNERRRQRERLAAARRAVIARRLQELEHPQPKGNP